MLEEQVLQRQRLKQQKLNQQDFSLAPAQTEVIGVAGPISTQSLTPCTGRAQEKPLPPVSLEAGSALSQLAQHPEAFNFFQAVSLIEQSLGGSVVGEGPRAIEKKLQFHTSAQLHFYGGQVQAFWVDQSGGYHLQVSGFSLLGHEGVLPLHYTAAANAKAGGGNGPSALLTYLDFFHHRSLSLLYKAWKKYQVMCQYQEPLAEVFRPNQTDVERLGLSKPMPLMNQMLLSVLGLPDSLGQRAEMPSPGALSPESLSPEVIAPEVIAGEKQSRKTNVSHRAAQLRGGALNATGSGEASSYCDVQGTKEVPSWELGLMNYAGLLARTSLGAQDLEQLLSDYFQLPIRVETFQGSWQQLSETMQSCFANAEKPFGQNLQLGQTAVLGSRVWQMDAKVTLVIECASRAEFECFEPGARALDCLSTLVNTILGDSIKVDVQLNIDAAKLLPAQLDREQSPRLGFDAKLGQSPLDGHASTTVSLSLSS